MVASGGYQNRDSRLTVFGEFPWHIKPRVIDEEERTALAKQVRRWRTAPSRADLELAAEIWRGFELRIRKLRGG